jgi:hypothetical protein
MKASSSVLCSVLAAAYLAVHLPFLAPSLEDIDSINFALGLRDFDVSRHQPHPPGYPVYVALGRASFAAITSVSPMLEQVRAEAMALAFWSALAGAGAIVAAFVLFRAIADVSSDNRERVSLWGAAILAFAPLFWIAGSRPMSDLPGLALALGAQALLLLTWRDRRQAGIAGALAALAIGVRVQTMWLTLPLMVVVAIRHRSAGATWLLSRIAVPFAAGILVWAVPLVVASGGIDGYWRALGSQAGEDFAWVDMLWANPTPRRLAFALYETFVMPWGSVPLAIGVAVMAAVGLAGVIWRDRPALGLVCVAFVPYTLFHLLLQETSHVRYALPVLAPVAWLAGHGAMIAGRRVGPMVAAAVCVFAAWTALPGMVAYADEPHAAFRAIADMEAAAASEHPAAVFAHYSVRRPLQARTPAGVRVVEPPRTNEWLDLVNYWRDGGTAPVWFLADPRRTDLAIVDPQSRQNVRSYRWAPAERLELSGTRPLGVDWYRFRLPGWFAGEGWSLTPELGGMTRLAGNGVDRRPIEALVRRRPESMTAIIGARHLGTAADGEVSFAVAIDGRPIDEWTLDPDRGPNTLRVLPLAAGALDGAGAYARLTIAARSALPGRPTPAVAIRQFDIQPASSLVYAFDEGWHEDEYENATGRRWRWTSGRSVIRLVPPRAVQLTLQGESPLKYFAEPPTVRIKAGDRVIAERTLDADFQWRIPIPEADAIAADGRIAIETHPVYLPGREEGTSDERQLGLRLFDVAVIPSARD